MESHSVVWGLDIGHTSLKAVKLARSGVGVTVLGYAIEPLPTGDDVDREAAVVEGLAAMAAREGMGDAPVMACLSGKQIFSRTINVPVLNPKKIHKMVDLEARQQIPGDFEELHWGYHMSPSADGMSQDVALFAVKKDIVSGLVGQCAAAGLDLAGVAVSSLAVYNFVSYDQEFTDDEAVVVLDVGAESTELVVYQGDMLWMRNLSIAGQDVTKAFAKKLQVSFEEAEELKCQVEEDGQADRILRVIEPVLGELMSDVRRSLGFYKNQNKDAVFENVVVSGNTFRMPGMAQFMADRLGYAIIELVELEQVQVDPGLDRDHFLDDLQSLAVAMGLGLQGLGHGRANVNLLPSSHRIQAMVRSKQWAAPVVVGLVFVAWLAGYLVDSGRFAENSQMLAEISDKLKTNEANERGARVAAAAIGPLVESVRQYGEY
ncbi:MAG: type IV pilus assembly protein PilM, partial [Planctomycetota bacterium]